MSQEADPSRAMASKPLGSRNEAAQILRRFVAAVESGELEANSTRAKALLRRIEGAVVGLEAEEPSEGSSRDRGRTF